MCVYSSNFQADLEVARLKVDTLQLKKNIAESKVLNDLFRAVAVVTCCVISCQIWRGRRPSLNLK